jgi:hypothetical protein
MIRDFDQPAQMYGLANVLAPYFVGRPVQPG